jgi:hypothetical protein
MAKILILYYFTALSVGFHFREKRKWAGFREISFREKLTSILVHGRGNCLICFETLSGFDNPVGYLYHNTAVSFVSKQDPDLVLITQ